MGLFTTFILIAAIVISAFTDYQINGGGADCGSYGLNGKLPKSMNDCCIEHDKCYDQLKNRMGCDIDLGTCVLENCQGPHCIAAPIFTGLTAAFGSDTYLDTKMKVLEEVRRKIQINNEERMFVEKRLFDLKNAINIRQTQLERTGCFRYAMKLNGVPTEMFSVDNTNFQYYNNMQQSGTYVTAKIIFKIGSWSQWNNECTVKMNSCNYLPPYLNEPGSKYNATHKFTWIKTANFHWENLKGWFEVKGMSYVKVSDNGSTIKLIENMKAYCKSIRKYYSGVELKSDLRLIYKSPEFDEYFKQINDEKINREKQLIDVNTMKKFLDEVRSKYESLQFPSFSCDSPEDCCSRSTWGVWNGVECVDSRP